MQFGVEGSGLLRQPSRQNLRSQLFHQGYDSSLYRIQVDRNHRAPQQWDTSIEVVKVVIPNRDGGTGDEDFSQCSVDPRVQVGDWLEVWMPRKPHIASHEINLLERR